MRAPGRPLLVLLLAAVAVPALAPAGAHAAPAVIERPARTAGEAPRISVSPVRFPAKYVQRGDRVDITFYVRNFTTSDAQLSAVAVPLEAADSFTSLVQPASLTADRSAAATWMRLPFTTRELGAGRELKATAEIIVPRDAEPGVYAVAIAVSQQVATPGASGARVDADLMVGSEVFITVAGHVRREARIRSVDGPRVVFGTHEPTFTVIVENTGNSLLTFDSEVEVSSFLGIARRHLRQRGRPQQALPGGRRKLRMHWDDRPLMGWFQPRIVVVGGAGTHVRLERPLGRVYVLPPWWLVLATILAIMIPTWLGRRARRQAIERGELVGRARWAARRRERRLRRRQRRRETRIRRRGKAARGGRRRRG